MSSRDMLDVSDESLQLITGQIVIGQTILVAHSLGLFKILSEGPKTLHELENRLGLTQRTVQGMVSCSSSMNLVKCLDGLVSLSDTGKKYLDPESPTYYGGALELLIQHHEIMNYDIVKKAILSNYPQADEGKDIFSGEDGIGATEEFVKEIHQKASAPAYYWVEQIDLSNYLRFVDIAGGSGMHAIAASLKNAGLQGTVCDRKPVLKFTQKYINEFGLQNRMRTEELDLWTSTYPEGDVFFMADIFHDWNKEQCTLLAKKCYESMSSGGKIILHEMLFNEDKSGPLLTAAYHMKMLLWTQGQQYSFSELREILMSVGFEDIQKVKGLGNWSLVIGSKPGR